MEVIARLNRGRHRSSKQVHTVTGLLTSCVQLPMPSQLTTTQQHEQALLDMLASKTLHAMPDLQLILPHDLIIHALWVGAATNANGVTLVKEP